MKPILPKIMMVDDEDDIRKIAQVALERIGKFDVVYCNSGKQALANINGQAPDLVLLDVMMPEMDGVTTMKEIRKLASYASIPVIFMTAKIQTNEIQSYLDLGAVSVITKPFDPLTLSGKILDVWNKLEI